MAEIPSNQLIRVVDASLNRVSEGLRVLEEVARMVLNDKSLSQELKTLRHRLVVTNTATNLQLLEARNAENDVGTDMGIIGEKQEKELLDVLISNARRVQESLRTLEELAKIPGTSTRSDTHKFRQARFSIYTIERLLISKLLRKEKAKLISGLYVIIDTRALQGREPVEIARQVIQGGAKVIQLRDKLMDKKTLLDLAKQLKAICTQENVLFIMNDYLDLALAVGADGLHLGQQDLPFNIARKLMPIDMLLGCSVTTVAQAIAAKFEGADYIAVGSIYPTSSKENITLVGLERLREVRQAILLPLVGIGGITKDNTSELIRAGADSVCVISAVLGADSPVEAARQITDKFHS